MPRRPARALLAVLAVAAAGLGVSACGTQPSSVDNPSADIENGARLFVERCAGCHTFDVVGAEGGASQIHDRERVDGPNFNERREDREAVLYAIRNGGFSGAIMPENLVVGKEADDVAAFVAEYAGRGAPSTAAPAGGGEEASAGGGETTATAEERTTPTTETQTTPQAETAPQAGGEGEQAAAQGKQVFTESCGGCHTLADAGTTGNVGPNLDQARPDAQATEQKVRAGGGGMPAFEGQLSDDEITAVAEYVASVAGR